MASFSSKIAYPIILTGLFVIVVFVSLFYDILSVNFYIILIPLTAFLFLFGFAIGQKLASPVKRILQEADNLSRGSVRSQLHLTNKDEFGQLAKAFNKIARAFEENKSKIESLDTNVKLRTRALEEIIEILEEKVKNRTLELEKALRDEEILREQLAEKEKEVAQIGSRKIRKRKKAIV